MTGIELIAKERRRQIEEEGFTEVATGENYELGELAGAAACYTVSGVNKMLRDRLNLTNDSNFLSLSIEVDDEDAWPWDDKYDKREKHDYERSLVIAGALIVAELDRLNSFK